MFRPLLWRIAAALLPAGIGAIGTINGFSDWDSATTVGQHLAGAGVIAYSPLGIAAAIALIADHALARPLLIGWGVAVTFVAGVAPVAWGDAPPMIGVVSAFSSGILVAAVLWAAAQGTRRTPVEAAE
jgi:hypothetical protein